MFPCHQVRASVSKAQRTGKRFILYTEPDKQAFFNRWIKIGVSQDAAQDVERLARFKGGLPAEQAAALRTLYEAVSKFDADRGWVNRRDYQFSPTPFYALAEVLRNLGFPKASSVQRECVKTATFPVTGLRQESLAPKQDVEGAQVVNLVGIVRAFE